MIVFARIARTAIILLELASLMDLWVATPCNDSGISNYLPRRSNILVLIVWSQTFFTYCPIMFQGDITSFFLIFWSKTLFTDCPIVFQGEITYFFKIFWFQTFQWRSNIFAFNILVPDFLFRLFNVTKLHTYPLEMYWSLSIKRNIDVFHSVYGFRENWWTSICMFIKVKFENIFNIILKSNICFKIHLL